MNAEQSKSTKKYEDNAGATDWASGIGQSRKNKQVDIRSHHVRDLTKKEIFQIQYAKTRLMLADILTKPSSGPKLKVDIERLGITKYFSKKEKKTSNYSKEK